MIKIIVAYPNPDLDGVACAVALEALEGGWSARVIGHIDEESVVVFEALGLETPQQLTGWTNIEQIWLVDTHHPNQLPHDLPEQRVVRVVDHHTGGEPARYPNAEIQNENVGAAATLVSERYFAKGKSPSRAISQLLQAAIISNTLNFMAPATTERDKRIFSTLQSVAPLPADLPNRMNAARTGILSLQTSAVLARDVKVFRRSKGDLVAVAQVEASGALRILERADLRGSMSIFRDQKSVAAVILNLVDTTLGKSAIVATDSSLADMLRRRLSLPVDSAGTIWSDRLLQRKTDIVPFLIQSDPNE